MLTNKTQTSEPDQTALDIVAAYVVALASRDSTSMDEFRSDDFVLDWVHGDVFDNDPASRDDTNRFWPNWFTAFPEMDYEVTRTIAAESVIVTQWIFTGVHSGDLGPTIFGGNVPPSGRTIRFRGVSIYDVANGQIQRETRYMDLATIMVELGIQL